MVLLSMRNLRTIFVKILEVCKQFPTNLVPGMEIDPTGGISANKKRMCSFYTPSLIENNQLIPRILS